MAEPRNRIGVVCGLRFERAILTRWRGALGPLAPLTACAAADPEQARQAALSMIDSGVQGLASFGIAGALEAHLAPGDLLLADEIVNETGTMFCVSEAWRERLEAQLLSNVHNVGGRLVSVSDPVTDPRGKAELHRKSGASAVDMETAAVAEVACSNDLPFIAVRAIADAADQGLPDAAMSAAAKDGTVSIAAAITGLLRHPQQVPATLRLAMQTAKAKRTLARVAHAGLPTFGLL